VVTRRERSNYSIYLVNYNHLLPLLCHQYFADPRRRTTSECYTLTRRHAGVNPEPASLTIETAQQNVVSLPKGNTTSFAPIMASLMDRDPWTWTIADAIAFFTDRHARVALAGLPGVNLPPPDYLTANFVHEEVTGMVLLSSVDDDFLRRRCKIAKLGPRAAVLHCIRKLRVISPGYKSEQETTIWPTPAQQCDAMQLDDEALERLVVKLLVPGGRLIQLLASQLAPALVQPASEPMQVDEVQPAAANASAPVTSDQTRPNESLVETKNGKKQRRLDLSAPTKQVEAASISQAFSPDDLELSLPGRRLPVDNIFFGDTKMGKECEPVKIDHPLYVHEGSNDKEFDEKNFQYINLNLHLGVAGYVGARLQRSLYLQDETEILREKRHAVAKYPYGLGLQAEGTNEAIQYGRRGRISFEGTRSAMVVQCRATIDEDLEDPCIATRENETILANGAEEFVVNQADLSAEHEFLLLKYKQDPKDLMSEDDASTEEDSNIRDEDTSNDSGDDQAEEDDGDEAVAEAQVKDIIDQVLDGFVTKWKEIKLPKLEAKKAWKVWKQTKHSRAIRDQLVQGARTNIAYLQSRLLKARNEVETTSWEDRAGVERSCKNLEVTVEDIEEERWKIEVWGRRQEPDHTSASKVKNKHAANVPTNPQQHNPLPDLGLRDRLSVSPKPESPPPPPPTDFDGRSADVEQEQFHTPQGSPILLPEDSPFVVPDDDGDDMQIDEPAQATAGAEMDEDQLEPAVVSHHTPAGHSERSGTPDLSTRAELLASFQNTTSADMPSPSVLAQRKSIKRSPATSVIDITELPSSSDEPTTPAQPKARANKSGTQRKRGRLVLNDSDDNEKPSTSEADQWRFSDLVEQEDRNKILQKLLRNIGQRKRENLHKTIQELQIKKFLNRLMAQVDAFSARDDTPSEEDAKETPRKTENVNAQMVELCARLLLAFYFARPDAYSATKPVPADILAETMPSPADVQRFFDVLRQYLLQRGNSLYSSPMPGSFDNPAVIDTDDEAQNQEDFDPEDLMQVVPASAKRRKKIKLDVGAAGKRQAARARMEESQQQQSSNPTMLQNMLPADFNPGDKIINPLHTPDQEPIPIEANIAQMMKPYQLDGAQFLWRELTGDLDRAQGCLLAHTMGLGKTMQSITLLQCVDFASRSSSVSIRNQLPLDLRLGNDRGQRVLKCLVICPSSLLQNWRRELDYWLRPDAFGGRIFSIETTKEGSDFMTDLRRWSEQGGILLIGYPLFRTLVNRKPTNLADEDKNNANKVAEAQKRDENMKIIRQILTQDAELVVADEAHQVKNSKSQTAEAASKLRSHARIALTGTPMSNDVDEIYALVTWVTPGFLGDQSQFNYFFGVPIKDGLYAESTPQEKRASTIKLKSLHYQIEPKVHRAGISVLKGELKPKVEFVLTVELTEQQRRAYASTVAALLGPDRNLDETALTRIFAWLGVLGLLTAHPRCFRQKLLTPKAAPKERTKRNGKAPAPRESIAQAEDDAQEIVRSNEGSPEVPGDESVYALGFTEAIVNALVEELSDDIDPALSAKTRLLQQILHLSKKCNDKVLIFSASIPTLDYLSALLERDQVQFSRIDGSIQMKDRANILADFQDPESELDVMLISTRAGGQGLNIQSANRVIIFDFGFNPAWEEQAVGRAYRFGQEKPVFVYRFVAGGTFESNIYNTQMFKTSLASRVVDKKNPRRNATRNTRQYLYPPKDVRHENLSNELDINLDPNVLSKIMQAQIDRGDATDPSIDICSVRTMEVLQAEAADAPLDEDELKKVADNTAMWKANRGSGFRLAMPNLAEYSSLMQQNGVPSSTAPVTAGPSALRTASMPSSTQVPSHPTSTTSQPLGQAANPGTPLAARDIRNGSGKSPPRANVSMGGLPFAGPK
jgi:SNF2 family DNA or RNA helicase